MPGGVMLQIGIHYTDVLTYLMGPVKAVRGQFAQLVLPGDNPDVASLILEHESGALSTLNASYASASEYYLMNIYGKDATAYYDLHGGLRLLKRGEDKPAPVPVAKNDTFVEELEEFAAAMRGSGKPEVGGDYATDLARGGARRNPVGARGAARRSGGDFEERLKRQRADGRERVLDGTALHRHARIGLAGCVVGSRVRRRTIPTAPSPSIVPFPAGGPSDVVARIVADHMSQTLGQSLVIENVGGAGGTIGSGRVASGGARRLHAAGRHHGLACRRAGADAEHQVRLGARLHPDRPDRAFAGGHRRAQGFSGEGSREFVALLKAEAARLQAGAWRHRRVVAHGVPPVHHARSAPSRRWSPIAAPARR